MPNNEKFFIGREQEVTIFEEILQSKVADAPWIIYIYDALKDPAERGGVGKTWLLRRFMELAQKKYTDRYLILDEIIDYSDGKNRLRLNVLHALYQQLRKQTGGKSCPKFEEAQVRYQDILKSVTAPGERRQARLEIFRAYARCYNDLVATSGRSRGIRFYDTFESVEEDLEYLTAADVPFPMTDIKDRSIVVIAGRNPIDWQAPNWKGREAEVQEIKLEPFSEDEAVRYFENYCGPDIEKSKILDLYLLTKGRPILIALAVDLINELEPIDRLLAYSPDRFLESLVSDINNFSEPRNFAIPVMAHIHHRFDRGWLEHMLGADFPGWDFAALEQELLKLSFVKPRGSVGQFVLHDEMRQLINKIIWIEQDPGRKMRIKFSQEAVEYYDRLIEAVPDEREKEVLQAERLYHQLYVDVEEGYEYFNQLFENTLIRLVGTDIQEGYEYFDKLFEKVLLERQIIFCQLLWTVLEDSWDRLPEPHKTFALTYHKGWLLVRQEKLEEAKSLIENGKARLQALGVVERIGEVANLLGYCYRLLGEHDNALINYRESLEHSQEKGDREQLAETLNNIANVYRRKGELGKGRDHCKIGLALRQELLKEQKTLDRKRALGNSLYVMGMILWRQGTPVEASESFRDAYNLYQEIGDETRMALVDKEAGYLYFGIGDDDKAERYWRNARRVFEEQNMLSELADTLNMIGRLHRKQGQMTEAKELFNRGLELAEEIGDHFRQTECHLSLCILYYRLRQYDRAEDHYKRGSALARQYYYLQQWSIYEGMMGNIAYDQGNLSIAFKQYFLECKLSADYGAPRLERAQRELEDRLIGLPKDERETYCNYMIEVWQERGLDEKYPSIVDTCQRIKEYLV